MHRQRCVTERPYWGHLVSLTLYRASMRFELITVSYCGQYEYPSIVIVEYRTGVFIINI